MYFSPHFHLALDWNNASRPIWWLEKSIKPCKLNESVFVVTNTNCVYLLTSAWMFYFLKVQNLNLSPSRALNYTKMTRSRVGLVSYVSWILILHMACSCNFYRRYFLKKSTSCYLVTSSFLIYVYFTNQESFLLISAEIKKWKSH